MVMVHTLTPCPAVKLGRAFDDSSKSPSRERVEWVGGEPPAKRGGIATGG